MDKVNFGQWLLKERNERGWSQREMDKRSGVIYSTIQLLEVGKQLPTADHIIAICKAFRIDPVDVMRKFGLLPSVPDSGDEISRLTAELSDLSYGQRREVESFIEYLRSKKERFVDKDRVMANREAAPFTETAL